MSSSKYNVTLTNYARGLSQDISATLANFLAPEVVVPAATGQYKNFDDKNTFQVVDTSRAVGGVDVVRTYRDDAARSDILAVDWSEDIRVTSPVCARKLTAS
jgi:hypothetical protein